MMKSIAKRNMRNTVEHRIKARGFRSLNAYMRFNRVWLSTALGRQARGFGRRMLEKQSVDESLDAWNGRGKYPGSF